ncbi:hypothetical protein ACH4FX_12735 [Streptomyces sp. NPDC018019]|uniref:hypothetical protein n=1 Tax=Streptomyces sp. NPDC018019 TaxID=3365030 RepID=UPI0037B06D8D
MPFCLVGAWLARRNLPDDRPAPGSPRTRLDVAGLAPALPGGRRPHLRTVPRRGPCGLPQRRGARTAARRARPGHRLHRPGAAAHRHADRPAALPPPRPGLRHHLVFLAGITLYGSMLPLPLYWQQVRGEDALGAGLLLIPQGIGVFIARTRAGRHTDRFGLRHAEIPDAGIITRVAQQIGGSVGTAALAVVLQRATGDARTPGALADGFRTAFWWSVAFTAVAVPLCLLLPGRPEPQAPAGKAETGRAVRA